jgi:hypothetical protein
VDYSENDLVAINAKSVQAIQQVSGAVRPKGEFNTSKACTKEAGWSDRRNMHRTETNGQRIEASYGELEKHQGVQSSKLHCPNIMR